MDNASKALIIAGGILIGVMVISVAFYVLTTARGFARTANDEAEASAIQSFNKFYLSFKDAYIDEACVISRIRSS